MSIARPVQLKKALITVSCILLAITAWTLRAKAASDPMTIYAIDLGQNNEGEATMIEGGDGASLLIDAGDKDTVNIFSWLKANGYKSRKFDILITHWHDDHIYYVARIIKDYPVGKVYLPGTEYATTQHYRGIYRDIINAANKKKTKVVTLKKNMTISVGSYVTGKVLYVNGYGSNSGSILEKYNNQSAAIMFKGGGSRFLTCGDAMEAEEKKILASGADIRADIFKLNHHGYPRSNTRDFVDAVSPSYGWFTTNNATPGNYNPVSVREIVRTISAKTNLFSTRYNGTIEFRCSGGKISVSAARNTAKMYRRVRDTATGKERTVTFTFNKFAVPRFTDKILDTKSLLNSRQIDKDGRTFHGDLVQDSAGYWNVRDDSGMYGVYTLARSKGRYYWIERNGRRFSKGKIILKGKEYCFMPDRKSGFVNRDGYVYYYADESLKGFEPENEGVIVKGFATIAGRRYYFKDTRLRGYKNYMAGRMATGWNTISGNKYYMNDRGVIQKGLKEIHRKKYCFDKYGIMLKGMKTVNGARFYFDPDYGHAHTNEWYPSDQDHRYYFGPDGRAYVNKNVVIAGFRYHFNGKGNPYVGWHEFNGKTYYAYNDGRLASGRKTIAGRLYIFDTMKNGCALLTRNPSAGITASGGQDTAADGNTSATLDEEILPAGPGIEEEQETGPEEPGTDGDQEAGAEDPESSGENENGPEEPGTDGEQEIGPEEPGIDGDQEISPEDQDIASEHETEQDDPGDPIEQETGQGAPENGQEQVSGQEEGQDEGLEGPGEDDAGSGSTLGV